MTVVDRDTTRIAAWQSAHLPVHEPELSQVVRVSRDGTANRKANLFFTTDSARSLAAADMIFLAVNTPTKMFGMGAGRATDMTAVDEAVCQISRHARRAIIVEKSTVPCGTAQRIRDVRSSPLVPIPVDMDASLTRRISYCIIRLKYCPTPSSSQKAPQSPT